MGGPSTTPIRPDGGRVVAICVVSNFRSFTPRRWHPLSPRAAKGCPRRTLKGAATRAATPTTDAREIVARSISTPHPLGRRGAAGAGEVLVRAGDGRPDDLVADAGVGERDDLAEPDRVGVATE